MLTGDRVRLRAIEPSDAEFLWRWHNDPEVMRWMDDPYPPSLARIAKDIGERDAGTYDNLVLMIETLAERTIGVVALRGAQPETGAAELDIYLGERDTWGQGYATDAMRVICRYGFEKMRLHRISLTAVAENAAARHVYQKVGFVEEGRLREAFRRDGKWHDMILMGLLEGELR
ncbi:N-acetyltransferase [Planotetraspora thailandica]|uniref:N-acetyltransferase n=1 Tax=Planotetraspora thailandica TaxID=487172 RepID=A0A8J3UU71_9ACTN|nr:GNAT family N-acetyltransferase [Planotetraspora thailandica]GII52134.1 N-acetyltransferase [Planotetraspora thailandica]